MVEIAHSFRPNLDALLTHADSVSALKNVLASPELQSRLMAEMATPEFAARIEKLKIILKRAGVASVDEQKLKARMGVAACLYGLQEADAETKSTLHEAREPAAKLIEIVKRAQNRSGALRIYDAPTYTPTANATAAHDAAVRAAEARLATFLGGLEKFVSALPEPPTPDKRGRPAKEGLDAVVDVLVQDWEQMTGAKSRAILTP
jgi:hypothetical protein